MRQNSSVNIWTPTGSYEDSQIKWLLKKPMWCPLEALWKGHWVGTLTWYYFTAHGDWLEGFPRRLGRAWWLTLWDDLTAGCDGLEGWVAVGTQGDPVTDFGPGWGAFTSREVGPLAICRPPRLCFDEAWQKKWENVFNLYSLPTNMWWFLIQERPRHHWSLISYGVWEDNPTTFNWTK